jgi:hypothetical protein
VDASGVTAVRLLGVEAPLAWSVNDNGQLHVELPASLPVSAAHVLRIEPVEALRPR